jgi:hypothetical protein
MLPPFITSPHVFKLARALLCPGRVAHPAPRCEAIMNWNPNPNLLQAELITRFASRRQMHVDEAARVWIGKRAAKFRRWFQRHG